jgi:DNA invertase Pin-like site-specific DNA recombinase
MQKHLAIYSRVSSKRQDTASQEPELRRYADTHGGRSVWFTDKFTGRSMDRPGWNKLMAAVRRGDIDTIVCWRLDRLGRSAKGLTALFDELRVSKVNLVSLRDGVDLNTSSGRLLANVMASVAQFETELRAERVLAGQAVARSKGKAWGGSQKGWHWRVKPEQIRVIREMKAAGRRVTEIAAVTQLSRPTVYAALRNRDSK